MTLIQSVKCKLYIYHVNVEQHNVLNDKHKYNYSKLKTQTPYKPCHTDPGSAVYSGADLDIILSDIDDILQNVNCNGIVLDGDLNSDFSRHSGFVNNINMFMNNHDLPQDG